MTTTHKHTSQLDNARYPWLAGQNISAMYCILCCVSFGSESCLYASFQVGISFSWSQKWYLWVRKWDQYKSTLSFQDLTGEHLLQHTCQCPPVSSGSNVSPGLPSVCLYYLIYLSHLVSAVCLPDSPGFTQCLSWSVLPCLISVSPCLPVSVSLTWSV